MIPRAPPATMRLVTGEQLTGHGGLAVAQMLEIDARGRLKLPDQLREAAHITNVFIYAAGRESELRAPRTQALADVVRGDLPAAISSEV